MNASVFILADLHRDRTAHVAYDPERRGTNCLECKSLVTADAALARIASLEGHLRAVMALDHSPLVHYTEKHLPCLCAVHEDARSALEASAVPTEETP